MAHQASATQGQAPPSPAEERSAARLAARGDEEQQQTGQAPTPGQESASSQEQRNEHDDDGRQTFDAEYVKRLRAEGASYRARAKGAEGKVRTFEDRDKTEQQRLEERAATAEGRATAAETKLMRFEIALDKGIPSRLINRLQGSTREELEQDADNLLQEFGLGEGGQTPTRPDFGAGVRSSGGNGEDAGDMNAIIRRSAGRVACPDIDPPDPAD